MSRLPQSQLNGFGQRKLLREELMIDGLGTSLCWDLGWSFEGLKTNFLLLNCWEGWVMAVEELLSPAGEGLAPFGKQSNSLKWSGVLLPF